MPGKRSSEQSKNKAMPQHYAAGKTEYISKQEAQSYQVSFPLDPVLSLTLVMLPLSHLGVITENRTSTVFLPSNQQPDQCTKHDS